MGSASVATTATGTPSSAPAASGQQPGQPVIVDCLWKSHVRPGDFMLACGDGNSRLSTLHWSQWGADSAVASGVNVVNDCKPYCAAGKFHSYPVTVRLDHAQSWKKHPGVQHYTQMSLVYTDSRPSGFRQTVVYPLWD
jgi:hypothetical protein